MSLNRRHYSESGASARYHMDISLSGGGVDPILAKQLNLELKLHQYSQELLHLYKESQNWAAISQVAQTLVSSSARIRELKQRLRDLQDGLPLQLPYLEKISESEARLSLSPEPPVATLRSDKEDQPTLETPFDSLSTKVNNNNHHLAVLPECNSEKLPNSDTESENKKLHHLESDPASRQHLEVSDHDIYAGTGSGTVVTAAEQPEPIITVNLQQKSEFLTPVNAQEDQTEGVKEFEGVNAVNDIDKIVGKMESLAFDLNEQYDHMQSSEPPLLTENVHMETMETMGKRGSEEPELSVPVSNRGIDTSSESSEQFFSPRSSFLETGESEDGEAKEKELDDAESGMEEVVSVVTCNNHEPTAGDSLRSLSLFSVLRSSHQLEELYNVELKANKLSTRSTESSPVTHSYFEFMQLQEKLVSFDENLKLLLESHSSIVENRKEDSMMDSSKDLEHFLNEVASYPALRGTSAFNNFLKSSSQRSPSEELVLSSSSGQEHLSNPGMLVNQISMSDSLRHSSDSPSEKIVEDFTAEDHSLTRGLAAESSEPQAAPDELANQVLESSPAMIVREAATLAEEKSELMSSLEDHSTESILEHSEDEFTKEVSPEPSPVTKELSPEPLPVARELTPEPLPVTKELSPVARELTPEPSPVTKELSPEPLPVARESTPEPSPVTKELSPEPLPVARELTPEPLPVTKELSPVARELTPEPSPVTKELSPEPLPVVRELTPEPLPVTKELLPEPLPVARESTPEPSPVAKELSPEPLPVARELTPEPSPATKELSPEPLPVARELTPEQSPVTKELSPEPLPVARESTPEPSPVTKELSPEPLPVVRELTPEPLPVTKELLPKPLPVARESTPEPSPVTKELSPEPLPMARELTPELSPVTKELSPEPLPVARESTPEPSPVTKELSPEPLPVAREKPSPVTKELSPEPLPVARESTPKPSPVTKELSPEPLPVARESTPKPSPVTKELSPEPLPVQVARESTPEPSPVTKELSPEPLPVARELTPEPSPVTKELSPEPLPVASELTPEPSPVTKELSPEPLPVASELTPEPSPVTKELSPEPLPVASELTPEPSPVTKELSPEPLPVASELTPEPSPVTKELSPEPLPVASELTPEPSPVTKELSPEPLQVAQEVPTVMTEEVTLSYLTPEPDSLQVAKELTPEPSQVEEEVTPEHIKLSAEDSTTKFKPVEEESPVPVALEPVKELSLQVVKELTPENIMPVIKDVTPDPLPMEKETSPEPRRFDSAASNATKEPSAHNLPTQPAVVGNSFLSTASEEHQLNPVEGGCVASNGHRTESFDVAAAPKEEEEEMGSVNEVTEISNYENPQSVEAKENGDTLPDEAQPVATADNVQFVSNGSRIVSPAHSDHTLESSTTSSSSTFGTSTGNSSGVGDSPEKVKKMSTSMEGDSTLHMSLMSGEVQGSGDKEKKIRKRQSSMHNLRKSIGKIGRGVKRAASQHGRSKIKQIQEEIGPSLLSPVTSTEWDPTCLLEELYSDFRQSSRGASLSGESARYYGYLEKLPKNTMKASMMKGWKRRYFRVMDDKIYYYEDRTSLKALGFVRLSISRVTLISEKNQIQIQEKGGQSIMLKARDKEETTGWHRALLLEAAHPTVLVPIPTSPSPNQDKPPVLIIDIGAASVRAGYSGDTAYPEVFFPAVASLDATNYEAIASGNTALLPENRYGTYQIYPRKHNLRMDKHDSNLELRALECIIDTVVSDLDVDPTSTDLILTLPPTVPEQQCNELVEILFEVFGFSAICFQDQCLLSLYSYNTTSGVIVNIGDHIDIVPIIDGYTIEPGVIRIPHGGNALTENLSKLITMKGLRYFSETEIYIVRLIKEELCYVSQDYDGDLEKCGRNPAAYTRATDLDRFQLPDHRKVVALDVECFKGPEGFFDPGLWGKDILGVHELVWKAIQACPIDQRREMARKIYLSGASTFLPGFKERLQKELTSLSTTGLTIEVHAAPSQQQHAAFLGASVLATLGSFQNYLVTREEFNSVGFEALHKWSAL